MKRILCLTILVFTASTVMAKSSGKVAHQEKDVQVLSSDAQKQSDMPKQSDAPKRGVVSKYAYSIVPGVIVGGLGGYLCRMFDKKYPEHIPLHWIVEFVIRHSLTRVIDEDLNDDGIAHHAHLMHFTAWMSSWLAYMHT